MNIHMVIQALLVMLTFTFSCKSPVLNKDSLSATDERRYRILFYNTENFFDTCDDSLTTDEAFTPSGDMHWTQKRYTAKLKNIYKVIIAAGGWQSPDIIGLCEIENRTILQDIVNNTPLSKYSYSIIHKNSPDARGIDVALLFNSNTVKFIESECYRIRKKGLSTRDILYFKANLGNETCHFFVNHWPSRSAGQLETESDRIAAAQLLKYLTDSLFSMDKSARMILMGDFNDEPTDESLMRYMMIQNDTRDPQPAMLYNLTDAPASGPIKGTLKYQGQWNLFDQVIVSGSLLAAKQGLSVDSDGYRILDELFLLTEDNQYNGYKPFRTYNGFRYQGGFSDHLPVYIDLIVE